VCSDIRRRIRLHRLPITATARAPPRREDEDALLVLSRTFSDAATAYLDFVVLGRATTDGGGSPPTANPELERLSAGLVSLVTTAATCRLDPQISSATFPFWRALGDGMFSLRE
jgi:hypothetical protein